MDRGSWAPRWALPALLLLALALRLPGLGQSLWFDEIWYTRAYFDDPLLLKFELRHDVHPPLYPLLLLGWTRLFGDAEWVVRIPPLLAGLATVALCWDFCRRGFGPRVAALATLLLALSPPHAWYSQENKVNMLAVALATAAVAALARTLDGGRRRDAVQLALLGSLCVWTHASALLVLVPVGLVAFWRAWPERAVRRQLLLAAAAIAMAAAPLIALKAGQSHPLSRDYLRAFGPEAWYTFALLWLPHGNALRSLNPYHGLARLLEQPVALLLLDLAAALLLASGVVAAFSAARRASRLDAGSGWAERLLLAPWLVGAPLLLALASPIRPAFIERNLLATTVPYALTIAVGTAALSRPSARRLAAGTALALAAGGLVAIHARPDDWTVYKPRPDWQSAARFLAHELDEGRQLLLLFEAPNNELWYYVPRSVTAGWTKERPERIIGVTVCPLAGRLAIADQAPGFDIYVVHNPHWAACHQELLREVARGGRTLREAARFRSLSLLRLVGRAPQG